MDFSSIHELHFGQSTVHVLSYNAFDIEPQKSNLSPIELERLSQFTHPAKQREFMAVRLLKTHLFGPNEIQYDAVGAPFIDHAIAPQISISHSNHLVGIASAEYKLGFDLEPVSDKAKRLSSKFLSDEEKSELDTDCSLEMTKAWSAKEAMYKLSGRKGILFSKDLKLRKVDDSHWEGTILNPNERIHMPIHFSISGETVLTINPKPARIEKFIS